MSKTIEVAMKTILDVPSVPETITTADNREISIADLDGETLVVVGEQWKQNLLNLANHIRQEREEQRERQMWQAGGIRPMSRDDMCTYTGCIVGKIV